MPLIFDVDGKIAQDPTTEDIATGFASIDSKGTRSISVIMLKKPPLTLWAFGHPKEGYTLDINEDVEPAGTQTSKVTSPANPIPHTEIVKNFQDFAVGDYSWQSKYEWEPGPGKIATTTILKRLAFPVIAFVLIVLILKYVLKII